MRDAFYAALSTAQNSEVKQKVADAIVRDRNRYVRILAARAARKAKHTLLQLEDQTVRW